MLDKVKDIASTVFHIVFKVLSGLIILPLSVFVSEKWEWWSEEASSAVKWSTGIFFVPAAAFLYVAAPWWNDY